MAAGPGEREVKIAEYRDTKGGEYTDALSQALPRRPARSSRSREKHSSSGSSE